MKEYCYGLRQRTGRAPVIRKLGACLYGSMEQTPVVFRGMRMMVESRVNEKDGHPYICVRNLETGELSGSFGHDYYFASAFAEGDKLYVFATSRRDDGDLTMYQSEDSSTWHDPRGGHTVRMFESSDLAAWREQDVIRCDDKRLWNTSVCHGDGKYVMAIEVSAEPGFESKAIGQPFTCFFAQSQDLHSWTMMPDSCAYSPARYTACPALRYSEGWYYMVCLEALPCLRYAPYIYRTRDFDTYEVGFHNPIMMWSDEDRNVCPGHHFSDTELELLRTGLNINCSDLVFYEYEGKTVIYYSNGDQMSYSFLCKAEYDGPMSEFLKAFFQ